MSNNIESKKLLEEIQNKFKELKQNTEFDELGLEDAEEAFILSVLQRDFKLVLENDQATEKLFELLVTYDPKARGLLLRSISPDSKWSELSEESCNTILTLFGLYDSTPISEDDTQPLVEFIKKIGQVDLNNISKAESQIVIAALGVCLSVPALYKEILDVLPATLSSETTNEDAKLLLRMLVAPYAAVDETLLMSAHEYERRHKAQLVTFRELFLPKISTESTDLEKFGSKIGLPEFVTEKLVESNTV